MRLVDGDLPRVDELEQGREHHGAHVAVLIDPDGGEGGDYFQLFVYFLLLIFP